MILVFNVTLTYQNMDINYYNILKLDQFDPLKMATHWVWLLSQ